MIPVPSNTRIWLAAGVTDSVVEHFPAFAVEDIHGGVVAAGQHIVAADGDWMDGPGPAAERVVQEEEPFYPVETWRHRDGRQV
jgi:hypothetical protein